MPNKFVKKYILYTFLGRRWAKINRELNQAMLADIRTRAISDTAVLGLITTALQRGKLDSQKTEP